MEAIRPRIRVAGILIEDNKILLIQHYKNNKKYWLIPGGGNDWGETAKEALIREYKEETNMDIEVDEFLFLSETIFPNLKFVTKEELQTMIIYPDIKENLLKLMNGEKIETYLGSLWND